MMSMCLLSGKLNIDLGCVFKGLVLITPPVKMTIGRYKPKENKLDSSFVFSNKNHQGFYSIFFEVESYP